MANSRTGLNCQVLATFVAVGASCVIRYVTEVVILVFRLVARHLLACQVSILPFACKLCRSYLLCSTLWFTLKTHRLVIWNWRKSIVVPISCLTLGHWIILLQGNDIRVPGHSRLTILCFRCDCIRLIRPVQRTL